MATDNREVNSCCHILIKLANTWLRETVAYIFSPCLVSVAEDIRSWVGQGGNENLGFVSMEGCHEKQ